MAVRGSLGANLNLVWSIASSVAVTRTYVANNTPTAVLWLWCVWVPGDDVDAACS